MLPICLVERLSRQIPHSCDDIVKNVYVVGVQGRKDSITGQRWSVGASMRSKNQEATDWCPALSIESNTRRAWTMKW
jgi:hypothetical protein